jgi:hypothetical protein
VSIRIRSGSDRGFGVKYFVGAKECLCWECECFVCNLPESTRTSLIFPMSP